MKNLNVDPTLVRTSSSILLPDSWGGIISVNVSRTPSVTVKGCPVSDGESSCVPFCSGGWPGLCSKTSAELTMLIHTNKINPASACGPIYDRIVEAQRALAELEENEVENGIL